MPTGSSSASAADASGPKHSTGCVGVHRLGRVDADEAHRLDPPAGDLDLERVAVDQRHDDAAVGRGRVAGAGAPAGAEQRTGEQQREGANHEGLPVVFRSAPGGARRLEALQALDDRAGAEARRRSTS